MVAQQREEEERQDASRAALSSAAHARTVGSSSRRVRAVARPFMVKVLNGWRRLRAVYQSGGQPVNRVAQSVREGRSVHVWLGMRVSSVRPCGAREGDGDLGVVVYVVGRGEKEHGGTWRQQPADLRVERASIEGEGEGEGEGESEGEG